MLASPLVLRLLVRYSKSPVGGYQEHALVRWSWRGPHVSQMSVSSRESKIAGREIWGFPKVGEKLSWRRARNHIEFHRDERVIHIHIFGPRVSLRLPFWTAQKRESKWVIVPAKMRAQMRLCRIGRGFGLALENMELNIAPPRPALF